MTTNGNKGCCEKCKPPFDTFWSNGVASKVVCENLCPCHQPKGECCEKCERTVGRGFVGWVYCVDKKCGCHRPSCMKCGAATFNDKGDCINPHCHTPPAKEEKRQTAIACWCPHACPKHDVRPTPKGIEKLEPNADGLLSSDKAKLNELIEAVNRLNEQ